MIRTLEDFRNPFFIGIAGSGMSAIAQYLQSTGKQVAGSDRFFVEGQVNETRDKLEAEGIRCYLQNGEGITSQTDLVVASSAIEETVPEIQKARQLNIPVLSRAEMLSIIAASKKTIAVGGTSGKSTTSAMLFAILEVAGLDPGIISGAGLVSLIRQNKIGNAKAGKGEWLVIEADESDGSIVHYKPEIGVLLNVDKDHKEIDSLMDLFRVFKSNCKDFIVNRSHPLAAGLSQDHFDFSTDPEIKAACIAENFSQQDFKISFTVSGIPFTIQAIGKHNMENAVAAIAAAAKVGVDLEIASKALAGYEGIYRRNQVFGNKHGVWLVDDYAHNPVKCAAAIRAVQPVGNVIAWFQPHGYGPTKFLRKDFVDEIAGALRPVDQIWMSEIFYAGGTTTKDISAADLISDLQNKGVNAHFVEKREDLLSKIKLFLAPGSVLLLMGARDPSLEQFAKKVWENL